MQSVPVPTLIWRGLRRRCGRCGARRLFTSYFHLRDRCPKCGYKFAREEGFFTGVYLINYGLTALVLVAEIMFWIGLIVAKDGDVSIVPALVLGALTAIVLPIACYPWAATTWAAIDLAARPLDPIEEAEAAVNAATPEPPLS
jgi:uncharacterized protein (DUF983 family)